MTNTGTTAQTLRRLVIWSLVGSNLLVIGLSFYSLLQSRHHYQRQAEVQTQNIAQALNQNISSAVGRIDLGLKALADQLEEQLAQGGLRTPAINALIARYEQRIPDLEAIRIADASGQVIFGRGVSKETPITWKDRPYFKHHQAHADNQIQISKPILGRVAKQPIIGFSVRYNYPDGRFAGVISAPVPVTYFTRVLSKFELGANGTLILRDLDRELITRLPPLPDKSVGQVGSLSTSSRLKELVDSGISSATYQTPESTDGFQRTVTYQRLDNAPMMAVVGAAADDYLAGWKREIYQTAALLVGFLLLSLVMGRFLIKLLSQAENGARTLEEREAQLRTLIEAVPDSVQFKDGAGRWLVANSVSLETLGLSGTDWKGKTDAQIAAEHALLAEHLDRSAREDALAWQQKQLRRTEALFVLPDGSQRYHDLIRVPLFDQAGQALALVVVGRDVTESTLARAELTAHREQLEKLVDERTKALMATEAWATHIVDSSADGLYGVDLEGNITFVNPAACAMLGYRAEDMIGRHAHLLMHHSKPDGSPYPAGDCRGLKAIAAGAPIRVDDEVYWHADGHPIPVMYAIHPLIEEGKPRGGVISFVDMSAQRAAAEARENALAVAEHLARVKSEFLANMSHEIRTPLNGVLGFAEIGSRNTHNPDKARDSFDKIIRSGKRLLGIINDILDFSKMEAGKLGIEQTTLCLGEVIDQAQEVVSEQARAKRISLIARIAPDLPSHCEGDPLRLGQVLLNLLSNAVKFTEEGSVTLSVWRDNQELVFQIKDTGIGIDPSQLERLFNPFQQADNSSSRRFGGTGLGLAICKRILELMRGSIHAESVPGQGTTMEFRIPYLPATPPEYLAQPQAQAAPGHLALAGIRILVAEDDLINQEVIAENLKDDGAEVHIASNGHEAVQCIAQAGGDAYDVVLMDIQMPDMDGYETTRRIRALAPDLPIIAQTAHAFAEEQARCEAAGMAGHISKPIHPDALTALIRRIVTTRRAS